MGHSQRLALTGKLLAKLREFDQAGDESPVADTVLPFCAILQLARCGIRPHWPADGPANQLFGALSAGRGPTPFNLYSNHETVDDRSQFARATSGIATSLADAGSKLEQMTAWASSASVSEYSLLLDDPCLLGWLYQMDLRRRNKTLRASGKVAVGDLARATQWFTPEWIAEFLVEETVGSTSWTAGLDSNRFLDPACGAGHIMVRAFAFAASSAIGRGAKPNASARSALDQLFGIDIDPLMLELSAFALYLKARQLCRGDSDLPVPNLFLVRTAAGDCPLGALRLLQEESLSELSLRRPFTGENLPLSALPKSFAAIAANPPYLSHRLMPPEISQYLRKYYPTSQYDLYSAFLSLGCKLLARSGRLSMISQQSFLSIQRYRELRQELACDCRIEAIALLGPGSFAAKSGEKVSNALITLQKLKPQEERNAIDVRCWRLLADSDKREAEARGLKRLRPARVPYQRIEDASSSSAPLSFWHGEEIAALFQDCRPLAAEGTGIVCSNGLFTCDNKRFVKLHDELAATERHLYVPYDKGGGQKWFRTTPYMLRWESDGESIRRFRKSRGQSAALPGEEFYFRPGVTYSYIGTRGFKARMLSPGAIFDIASSAIFSSTLDQSYIVGFLNSSLVCFMLGILNPTINFQIGDLRRVPFKMPDPQTENRIIALSAQAIALAKRAESFDPLSPMYVPLERQFPDARTRLEQHELYLHLAAQINSEEQLLQSEIDTLIFDLYEISQETRALVAADPWVVRSRQPLAKALSRKQLACAGGGSRD